MTEKDEIKDLIERRKHEDKLLNTRTGIILTFNGLVAIAISKGNIPGIVGVFVVFLIIVIDTFWIFKGCEAARYIRKLNEGIKEYENLPPSEELWEKVVSNKRLIKSLGPTMLVGEIIPILLLISWVGGLFLAVLCRLFKLLWQHLNCS